MAVRGHVRWALVARASRPWLARRMGVPPMHRRDADATHMAETAMPRIPNVSRTPWLAVRRNFGRYAAQSSKSGAIFFSPLHSRTLGSGGCRPPSWNRCAIGDRLPRPVSPWHGRLAHGLRYAATLTGIRANQARAERSSFRHPVQERSAPVDEDPQFGIAARRGDK